MCKKIFRRIRAALSMFLENVRMSLSNIMHSRMRSILTILGIMIGVTAVIALITTVSGVSNSISDTFSSLGAGSMTLSISGSDLKSGLTADDIAEISALELVDGVTPSASVSTRVSKGSIYESAISISGVNQYWFTQNEDSLQRGRIINHIDTDNMNRVCLIDQEMVEEFFYGRDPLGEKIYISGLEFSVIGTFDADSDTSITNILTGSPDIMIPYTTALKMNGTSLVTQMKVYMADGATSEQTQSALEATLDPMFSYEEDCYTITTMDSIEETMATMMSMMSTLLAGIASIALLVGGIGIMNMMLTSVTERTIEIGLKKALGAKPRQIQTQFLLESFILSLTGGIIGVILGLLLSMAPCSVMGTKFVVSYGAIGLGVGFSAAVGIIFGWAPARKASRLNPIDALRRT